jgi:hypothetical protein
LDRQRVKKLFYASFNYTNISSMQKFVDVTELLTFQVTSSSKHFSVNLWLFHREVTKLSKGKGHPTTGPLGVGRGGWSAPRPGHFTLGKDPVPVV